MLHRHEALGFEVQAPAGWSVLEESERGLLLGTSEDGGPDASASITVEAVEPGAQLAALTSRALSTRAQGTGSVRLIERLDERVGAGAAERVVLHREAEGRALTVEEWRLLAGDRLVTISAACPTPAYDRHADAFAALAHSFAGQHLSARPAGPLFDPTLGLLVTTEAGFDALRALAGSQAPRAEARAELEGLAASGAIVDDQPHPALARALEPAVAPLLSLSLTRTPETIRAWADATQACLLVPVGTQGWRRLMQVRPDQLPDTLARLVGQRPTGQAPSKQTITLSPADLALLVASEQGQAFGAAGLAEIPEEARAALSPITDHWRIEAHRHGDEAGEMLEVLEADQGLWLVVGQHETVELRATDAAAVWRHLSQFIPAA